MWLSIGWGRYAHGFFPQLLCGLIAQESAGKSAFQWAQVGPTPNVFAKMDPDLLEIDSVLATEVKLQVSEQIVRGTSISIGGGGYSGSKCGRY